MSAPSNTKDVTDGEMLDSNTILDAWRFRQDTYLAISNANVPTNTMRLHNRTNPLGDREIGKMMHAHYDLDKMSVDSKDATHWTNSITQKIKSIILSTK